jgi:hypothetical protein
MIKYNTVVCGYGKMLVNVAACVISGQVCVWCAGQEQTGTGSGCLDTHFRFLFYINFICAHVGVIININ